jgi:hypothetical protein
MLAICLAAQSLALKQCGGKTVKSESNYFSSIARIQTESQDKPQIMMLGSSMTGRLGDRAQHFEGVANLGCDGGSSVITLRAMDRGILPIAPILIVEANSLVFELEGRGKEIGKAIKSPWFRVGIKYSSLSATARPTAFAYSWLMARSSDGSSNFNTQFLPITTKPSILTNPALSSLSSKEEQLVTEVTEIFGRLSKKGSKILLVMLPPGNSADSAQMRIPLAVAVKSAVSWWDLNSELPTGSVGFSDGLHLDNASAQKVMLTIMREVKNL